MTTLIVMSTEYISIRQRDVRTVPLDSCNQYTYKNGTKRKLSLICVKIDDEEMEEMTLFFIQFFNRPRYLCDKNILAI